MESHGLFLINNEAKKFCVIAFESLEEIGARAVAILCRTRTAEFWLQFSDFSGFCSKDCLNPGRFLLSSG